MNNKIIPQPEGYTEIILTGHQTGESIRKTVEESFTYDERLAQEGKTVKTLIDLKDVDDVDEEGVKSALSGFKSISFDKIAIYGANGKVGQKLNMILPASGNDLKVKLFTSREEALNWLI